MPYSIVIDLYSNNDINKNSLNSRVLNALVLNIIRSSDSELSKHLHDEEFDKSMTLRRLYYKENLLGLRLTLLDEKLFERFGNVMINACTHSYDLNGAEVRIAKISSSKQSGNFWSDYTTYKELLDNASKSLTSFSFNIITPLSFKKGDSFLAFPMPDLLFKSLHKRWNKHSYLPFDDLFLEFINRDVFISYYDLHTDQVKDNMKIAFTGCKGKITFKVSPKAPEKFIHYLNVLSDYAYFAGVGAKTTMGMGQLHRVIPDKYTNRPLAIEEKEIANEV